MEREKVINALECLGGAKVLCAECAYKEHHYPKCKRYAANDVLSLIKELTEEYDSMAKSVNEASELIRKLKADKKELTEENERLRVASDKAKLWENVLKAEAQEVPIKAETIRVADAITDEIYRRYRLGECFDQECHWTPFNSDKFKALIEDVRAKYIPEEKWEDRDC